MCDEAFFLGDAVHTVGDKDCEACHRKETSTTIHYPKECECGGLIHLEPTGRHDDTGLYFYKTKCDGCFEIGSEPRRRDYEDD
jgi:hypothetical protein